MWIMLIRRLPTDPAPPLAAIFWSVPWTNNEWSTEQTKRDMKRLNDGSLWDSLLPFGKEPDWAGARKIVFRGEPIRVFPHEFAIVSRERMAEYVGESHSLVPDGVAEERLSNEVLEGRLRPVYEYALLDGCSHEQALLVASGHDITIPDVEYPPLGWYRLREEYLDALGV